MSEDLLALKKIKEGNIKTFEHVFRMYYTSLCLYATSIIGRTDVAEEVVQDLFYVLWKERDKIQIFATLKGYLYRAVRNKSLQYFERADVRKRYEDNVKAKGCNYNMITPEEQLHYKELERLINDVLSKMPERRFKIFKMHRFEGRKYNEIANNLSVSVKTVEAEITKALRTLRKEIEVYTQKL